MSRHRGTRGRLARFALLALLAFAPTLASTACRSRGEPAAQAVDPALLAFLSRARAAHHRADLLESAGNLDRAASELTVVLDGPQPAGGTGLPEVREVLADTLARRADLVSRLGRRAAGVADVERGLSLATSDSYYRGHLYEVLGLVEERESARLHAQLDQLLASTDARAEDSQRGALEALRSAQDGAARRLEGAPPADVDAARRALADASRALAEARRSRLTATERRRAAELEQAAGVAAERALAAFEQAIEVQGRVIDESLPAGSGSAVEPSR